MAGAPEHKALVADLTAQMQAGWKAARAAVAGGAKENLP